MEPPKALIAGDELLVQLGLLVFAEAEVDDVLFAEIFDFAPERVLKQFQVVFFISEGLLQLVVHVVVHWRDNLRFYRELADEIMDFQLHFLNYLGVILAEHCLLNAELRITLNVELEVVKFPVDRLIDLHQLTLSFRALIIAFEDGIHGLVLVFKGFKSQEGVVFKSYIVKRADNVN